MSRRQSAFGKIDVAGLDDQERRRPTMEEIDARARMPSREAPPPKEGFDQINIKVRLSVSERFKRLARERGGQAKLLEAMMDLWEESN